MKDPSLGLPLTGLGLDVHDLVIMLPDVALLEMFNFLTERLKTMSREIPDWHTLVHLCRKWRNIVFG